MSFLKFLFRGCVPYGLVDRRQRRFRLQRLGLLPAWGESRSCEAAADACRFDLWPLDLRRARDWTLIDVGANEGDFIRAATRLGKPSRVIAFEPHPVCQQILAALFASIPDGQLIKAAAGAAPGEVELYCTGDTKTSSMLQPQPGIETSYANGDFAVSQKLRVPVVRLDDVIAADALVGLLKIDVQGYEMEVLRGAPRTLCRTDALLIEVNYTPHYKGAAGFDDIHTFLADAGFHLYGISAPHSDGSRPLWADAMYVRQNGVEQTSDT
jgi:FkbM family methyltransferase